MNYNCPVCKFNKHPFWEFTNFTKKKVSFKSCPKCNSTLEINYHVSEQKNRKRISVCIFCCVLCNIVVFLTQGIIAYIFTGLELCSLFLLFYFLIRMKKDVPKNWSRYTTLNHALHSDGNSAALHPRR